MLGNNIRKSQLATQKQADLVKINENTRKNLELEIRGYKEEAQAQRKEIYKLEKEREKYGAEASEATSKYLQVRAPRTRACTRAPCARRVCARSAPAHRRRWRR